MTTKRKQPARQRGDRKPAGTIQMSLLWMHVAELVVVLGEAPIKNRVVEFDLNRRWSFAFNGFGKPRGTSEAWAKRGRAPLRAIPKYSIYLTYDKVPAGVVLQVPDAELREPEGWLTSREIETRVLDAIHRRAAQLGRVLAICTHHEPQDSSCARALRRAKKIQQVKKRGGAHERR